MAIRKTGQFLGETRELPLKASREPQEGLQAVSIRIHADKLQELSQRFKSRGLGLSAGIRSVLYDFLSG